MTYRSISTIATEISRDWRKAKGGIYFGVVPYLDAMYSLDTLADKYGADDARTIVLYFLSNAAQWKGETAKRVKAELKAMLAGKAVAQPVAIAA
jgi:hypothetical protein